MRDTIDSATPAPEQPHWFTTTHWSVVLQCQNPDSPVAIEALESLCRAYWKPLYTFVRRQGYDEATAQDLTQGFFARLLQKNYVGAVRREKGKFRSFLLASMKHYLSDERDKARTLKRGGNQVFVSLDDAALENHLSQEPSDRMTPEKAYERNWAFAVLECAGKRLRAEYLKAGNSDRYERLQALANADHDSLSYADAAAELGLSEGGLRAAVCRMRQRFRELIRDEVAQTVSNPSEVDEELRYLLTVVCT